MRREHSWCTMRIEGTATLGGLRDRRERHRCARSRHHRPDPRPLDDPKKLGEVGRALRRQGLPRARPCLPRLRGRGRGAARGPLPHRGANRPPIVEDLENTVGELSSPPIIMGHSMGGLLTQILLDHGYGAAGVAIDSVPSEGIKVVPVSQIRALFPILRHPSERHKAVGFTPEQFHNAFANTLSREDSDEVYDRYYIPAPGNLVWGGVTANFTPGHQDTYVNFRNEDRAPLLFIAGG